jgi:hypothetical protein
LPNAELIPILVVKECAQFQAQKPHQSFAMEQYYNGAEKEWNFYFQP